VTRRMRWRETTPYVWAGLGGFALAWALVGFVVFPPGAPAQDGRVPNVIGLAFDAASQRLQQAGFTAERGEMRVRAAAPRLTVVQQTPEAGSVQQLGSAVTLDLSAGVQTGIVPNVVGLIQETADSLLAAAGFSVAEEVTMNESDRPRGTVLETSPRAGARASLPASVALTVSAGPANIGVPDLGGHTVEEARAILEEHGLELGDVTVVDGGDLRPGATVLVQSPVAGTVVVAASRVSITVSGGPTR
jgi:eukaryotic-like serine/threonine-protein kinase